MCLRAVSLYTVRRLGVVNMSSMNAPTPQIRMVAVCQMTSTNDINENLSTCHRLINKAKVKGAQMVFLPECFDYVSENKEQGWELMQTIDGPIITSLRKLAENLGIWLSLGGFHEKVAGSEKPFLSHIVINSSGEIVDVYHKLHLFSVTLPGVSLNEGDSINPGSVVKCPVQTPVGAVGLSICYDLRFPQLSAQLRDLGAEILTFPSAFTVPTGMAHWQVLLRARAIENQCYVIAAAQTGKHNTVRTSYGHAMVVDPWGCVLAECGEGTDVSVAEINLEYLQKVRQNMPVITHRRALSTSPENSL